MAKHIRQEGDNRPRKPLAPPGAPFSFRTENGKRAAPRPQRVTGRRSVGLIHFTHQDMTDSLQLIASLCLAVSFASRTFRR
jgi:hypothetical protein